MPQIPEKLVSIHLLGPISLLGRDDKKLTPRGKKAQAILALLALAPRGQRTRAWLRDKLWSDSDEKHASSSLRQSLFEIKRDIGPLADQILTIDRHAIGLRLNLVWVDVLALDQDPSVFRHLGLSPETELLEGMDISDPEFEDWLMMERQIWFDKAHSLDEVTPAFALVQQPQKAVVEPDPVLSLQPAYSLGFLPNIQHGCQSETMFLADYVLESISKNLREFQPLAICDFREISTQTGNPLNVGDTEFYVRTRCLQVGNSMTLTLFLYRASQMHLEWSQSIQVQVSDVLAADGVVLNGFIAQNVDRLAKSIFEDTRKAHELHDMQRAGYSALNLMFRLDGKDFAAAEGLLTDASINQQHSIYPALKAYLSSFKIGENLGLIEEANTKAAERLLTGVVEDNPFNAISLSCLGHVFGYVFQEHEVAGSLLERALALNKSQAFVWDHYALHKIYTGQYQQAFDAAKQANFLGAYSPVSYSYDITLAMAATMNGDHGRAVASCKTALRKQPRSAAAMRYLIVNYAAQGKMAEALKIYQDLLVIDPDFENPEVQMQRYRLTDTDMQAKFLNTLKLLPNT
ncbi:MAG: tetratricopeptide repeat protein [Sulfitobacter sp.]